MTTESDKLITDLFAFIENVNDETPDRNEQFFKLRERVRNHFHKPEQKLDSNLNTYEVIICYEEGFGMFVQAENEEKAEEIGLSIANYAAGSGNDMQDDEGNSAVFNEHYHRDAFVNGVRKHG
jgi:hypothetical protein